MAFSAHMMVRLFGVDAPSSRFFERQDLEHEAWSLGIELDPSDGQEGLRERVEAVKAGDDRAYSVASWAPVRAQKAQEREAAQKLAMVNGTSVDDARAVIKSVKQNVSIQATVKGLEQFKALAEVARDVAAAQEQHGWWDRSATFNGQLIPSGIFSGSMPVSAAPGGTPIPSTSAPTYPVRPDESVVEMVERQSDEDRLAHLARIERTSARIPHAEAMARLGRWEDVRAENRRIGEDIAKAPPEWAYPLAWRLAVMAVVESNNNRKDVTPFDMGYWERKVVPSLRAYHHARLDGLLPDPAMIKAVLRDAEPLNKEIVAKFWDGIACQAYERGRPGPGGVQ